MNIENFRLYQKYLVSMEASKGKSGKNTYRVYKINMQQFLKFVEEHHEGFCLIAKESLEMLPFIVEDFMLYCRNTLGNNAQSIKNKIVAISAFYRWCVRKNLITHHPLIDKIERPQVTSEDHRRKSYYLTWKQILTVTIKAELAPHKQDLRSRLMWELFLDSGFRINAVQSLKLSQLDLQNNCFKNVREKGGKIRDLYFYNTTKNILEAYLKERDSHAVDTDFIFYTKYNKTWRQMSQTCIRKRIRKLGKLVDIDALYPHSLRKTAINLIDKMLGRADAVSFAGHKNSVTTENHYIQQISEELQRDRLQVVRKNMCLI